MPKKNLYFNLPTGSHYRNLLQSEVLDELLKLDDYRFVLITDAWDLPEFKAEFSRFEADRIVYHPARLFEDNWREKLYRFMCNRFFLTKYFHAPARAWHAAARYLFNPDYYDKLFEKYPPDLVILPSPGYLKVTVGPDAAQVDYLSTAVPGSKTAGKNGAVAHSYMFQPAPVPAGG